MTSEEGLVKRFNGIIDEIEAIAREYEGKHQTWSSINPERDEMTQRIQVKVAELGQISIDKIALQRSIDTILKRVKGEIEKILMNTQLSETEKRIREILDQMQGDRFYTVPNSYFINCRLMRELSVQEKDLVKVEERVMHIMRKLVKAAEKLE